MGLVGSRSLHGQKPQAGHTLPRRRGLRSRGCAGGRAAPSRRRGGVITALWGSPGSPSPDRIKGGRRGPAPAPPPARHQPLRPGLSADTLGEARGGCAANSPQAGQGRRDTPRLSARGPAPGQAVSGCSRALPHGARQSRGGAGRLAQPAAHPATSRRHPHPTHTPAGAGVPGAQSQARGGGGGGAGGAIGGGAGHGVPRAPAGRANGCPAFGKIAIYGHVLGPRAPPVHARAPLRLNTSGGGRARSQSLQPFRVLCRCAAARPPRFLIAASVDRNGRRNRRPRYRQWLWHVQSWLCWG